MSETDDKMDREEPYMLPGMSPSSPIANDVHLLLTLYDTATIAGAVSFARLALWRSDTHEK